MMRCSFLRIIVAWSVSCIAYALQNNRQWNFRRATRVFQFNLNVSFIYLAPFKTFFLWFSFSFLLLVFFHNFLLLCVGWLVPKWFHVEALRLHLQRLIVWRFSLFIYININVCGAWLRVCLLSFTRLSSLYERIWWGSLLAHCWNACLRIFAKCSQCTVCYCCHCVCVLFKNSQWFAIWLAVCMCACD